MDDSPDTPARASRLPRSFPSLLAVLALALGGASFHAQDAPAQAPSNIRNPPMKQFVIIFRQGSRPLSEVDLKKRTEETRAWAQQQAGHKLDPHILEPDSYWSEPVPATSAEAITALLFLEARDFAQAVDVAKAHPALRYGSSIEVRPWGRPPAPPPATQP